MTTLVTGSPTAWDNPPGVAPRGTLIVIPGRGEHASLYQRFGTRLAFDAYRVRAIEDPSLDEESVLASLQALLADPDLPAPRVLVGSDSGALFALGVVAAGTVAVDGLVLAGLPLGPAPVASEWSDELGIRTACPAHQARLEADPDLRRGALAQELPEQWYARADLAAVTVPVLALHGSDDAVSPLAAVRERFETARPAAPALLVSIAGGRHDALNDATHRTAAATVVLFLERLRLGAGLPALAETEVGSA
jgi:alpha-beta hydrolase superfamily lysophospholipase